MGEPRRRSLAALGAAVLLAACAPQVATPPGGEATGTIEAGDAFYREARERGEAVYRIDAQRSVAVVTVRRGGSLAALGHDHVVASHDVAGAIAPASGRADLVVPLDRLAVDEPGLRAEAGMTTQPSAADIEGTRNNMRLKVLETDRYPDARIAVRATPGEPAPQRVPVEVTLHGTKRMLDAPVRIDSDGKRVVVDGRLTFAQSDFGIVPFALLGGAIAVQDGVVLDFHIEAQRME